MVDIHSADLSDWKVRRDLTPAARLGYTKIAAAWKLEPYEAANLILLPAADWMDFSDPVTPEVLPTATLRRIGHAVGIYFGLHTCFQNPLADEWPKRPNDGQFYEGKTPLQTMLAEGEPAIKRVRQYFEAMNGGALSDLLPLSRKPGAPGPGST